MIFVLNEELGEWEAKSIFLGYEIDLSIDNQVTTSDISSFGRSILDRLESSWSMIEANLIDSLQEKYNSAWAEPEEGLPSLAPNEFLNRIHLRSVRVGFIDDEQCLSLSFDAGELFAGHGIGIFWEYPHKMHPARLEG